MRGYEKPASILLEELGDTKFKLVCDRATPEQWAEWLRAPLEHAAATANRDLVSKLLRAGADGGAGWRGCDDKTLLHAAAEGGNVHVVSMLNRAGAGEDMDAKAPGTGHTPLHLTVLGGNAAAAKALIMAGADVNVRDDKRDTPLHLAIREGHVEIAEYLLLSGADPDLQGSTGAFPIHLAVDSSKDEIVVALAHKGVNLNWEDGVNTSPLLRAMFQDRMSIVRVLLAEGADVTHRLLYDGETVLQLAAKFNKVAAIPALMEAGADIESRDAFGRTPLFSSAASDSFASMRALLLLGADVNTTCVNGSSPLHSACRNGEADAADLLLRWGADETAENLAGSTPSSYIPAIAGAADEDLRRLQRLSKLLARAPQDRVWRRRGFLVLCRAHPDRVRPVVEIPKTAAEASGQQLLARPRCRARKGQQSKVEVEVGDAHGSMRGASADTSARAGIVRADGTGDGGGFEFAAGWLVALAEDDVFRKIIGFL